MACEVPSPRWWIGLLRPLSVSMWATGLGCVLAGIFLSSGLVGFLPPVGSLLVLLGTSNGAISALQLGSILDLPNGSRARQESLTKECAKFQAGMETVADVLCADPQAVRRTIGLTITKVTSEWSSNLGAPQFPTFLLCRTITVAREQDDIFGDGSASDSDHELQLILVLNRLSDVPATTIAHMLDRDVAAVRDVLARSAPRGSA